MNEQDKRNIETARRVYSSGCDQMTRAETALRCAQLYLRGGKRRLQQGFSAAGMTALYDSVLFGMRYYIAKHKRCASFVENTDLWILQVYSMR